VSVADTIFALATPPGQSAIAIVRISGANAHNIPVYFGMTEKPHIDKPTARYQRLKSPDNQLIDEVMLLMFPDTASPTGEDITEIQCHGSQAVIQSIMSHLSGLEGFRPAKPGEFSLRSFNNGKVGLLDLEGLADLIDAETTLQHQQAMDLMSGKLSELLMSYREELISISSRLETIIDFSDEDLPKDVIQGQSHRIQHLIDQIKVLVDSNKIAEQIRSGVKIALIGPVNAGKSTILNAFAKRDVAIVSSIAGTTRDVIEVRLDLHGIPVILKDTAGVRESDDFVENEGMKRARDVAEDSDFSLLVLDSSQPNWTESLCEFEQWDIKNSLVILNKSDLVSREELKNKIKQTHSSILKENNPVIGSFIDQSSTQSLIDRLSELLSYINLTNSDLRLTRSWHKSSCLCVIQALERALVLDIAVEPELIAEELRVACDALGRLTGEVAVDDLLDNIFSSFCIGK